MRVSELEVGPRAQKTEGNNGPCGDLERADDAGIVWSSPVMLHLRGVVHRIADSAIPVLVLGETGVGKEVVARELHAAGPRRDGPMQCVNCAAIPEALLESVLFGHVRGAFTGAERAHRGIFEQAQGGTVLLDEVGELSLPTQAALLRVLDTGRVRPIGAAREVEIDVRVIAATHRDVRAMVTAGTFRLDLLYRLNAVVLDIPPLRERREDIVALVRHFAAQSTPSRLPPRFDDQVLDLLVSYDWPGNVRELRNVIQRALALCEGGVLRAGDLPLELRSARRPSTPPPADASSTPLPPQGVDLRQELRAYEAALIERALEQSGGHQQRAARLLNLPLRTLERKLKQTRSVRSITASCR